MTDKDMIGDNRRDPAPGIRAQLTADYAALAKLVSEQQDEAATLPEEIKTQADHDLVVDMIVKLRTTYKTAETNREFEKAPYLLSERAVDGFFAPLKERITTTAVALNERVEDYLRAKAAAERKRREEEAAEAARVAARARAEQEAAERKRREAEERAEAARRKDYKAKHEAAADAADAEAATAGVAADNAEAEAHVARVEAEAKPAALARTRAASGTLSTLAAVWTYTIEDFEKIDLDKLRPYLKRKDIESAIGAFVKAGRRELDGVHIFETEKSRVR